MRGGTTKQSGTPPRLLRDPFAQSLLSLARTLFLCGQRVIVFARRHDEAISPNKVNRLCEEAQQTNLGNNVNRLCEEARRSNQAHRRDCFGIPLLNPFYPSQGRCFVRTAGDRLCEEARQSNLAK